MPWVPITDPIFREVYGEHAPTVESIFGGQEGLALLNHPDSVVVFTLRPMHDDDQLDGIITLGFFAVVRSSKPLNLEDCQSLFAALQKPENYGDQFLGVTSADFGFKVVSGTNVLELVFDLETPSVTITRIQQQHVERRAASLCLVEAACKVAQSQLKPDHDFRKRIGRDRSNKDLQHTK